MRRYEAMFLFDTAAAHDWAGIEQEVRRLCGRINAELVACVKFDERKLAYEIKRRKRGTYVLTYFDAPPERIVELERDVQLSECVLRALVLQADGVPQERIDELKAWPADTALQPASERRHDEHGGRGYGRSEHGPAVREAHGPVAPPEIGREHRESELPPDDAEPSRTPDSEPLPA